MYESDESDDELPKSDSRKTRTKLIAEKHERCGVGRRIRVPISKMDDGDLERYEEIESIQNDQLTR